MPANNTEIEKRLWDAADELRANSRLKPSECSVPVLGLIFLRYADHKFAHAGQEKGADFDFAGRLTELHGELELLHVEAHELEELIAENVTQLLDSMQ